MSMQGQFLTACHKCAYNAQHMAPQLPHPRRKARRSGCTGEHAVSAPLTVATQVVALAQELAQQGHAARVASPSRQEQPQQQ